MKIVKHKENTAFIVNREKMFEKLLGREGYLFDSHVYIFKAFFGIFVSQIIFSNLPFVNRDMISVLFGFMLILEPLPSVSLKRSFEMIWQSALAGICGLVIFTYFGLNIFTIPLVVAISMIISIRLDWRAIPTVLYFTSIYMGQFVQIGPDLRPDFVETFFLRIVAVLCGVGMGVTINWIFFQFSYKQMLERRATFIAESIFRLTIDPSEKAVLQLHQDLNLIEENTYTDTKYFYEAHKVAHYIHSMILEEDNFADLRTPSINGNAMRVLYHLKEMKKEAEKIGIKVDLSWLR